MTVANFVGLARGMKPWLDPGSKRVVTDRPFYDGLTFHRVVHSFVIQGGDPQGDGKGGPGYQFENEKNDLTFDRAGRLGMANAGPDTNGSQFFVTLGAFPHLDGMFTVFGQCDVDTPKTIASVEVETAGPIHERSRPTSPVVIRTVRFLRK
jgi:peptidyl-prolyl cis-trans isomerase A (cyclophilin A)